MMHSTSSMFGSAEPSLDSIEDLNCCDDSIDNVGSVPTRETKEGRLCPTSTQQCFLGESSSGPGRKPSGKKASFLDIDDCGNDRIVLTVRGVNFLHFDSSLSDYNDPPVDDGCPYQQQQSGHILYHKQNSDSSYSFCSAPTHSSYSSFLSSFDSNDGGNQSIKNQPNCHQYRVKSLASSSTTAAVAALKAVEKTTVTAALSAAGALSKISMYDKFHCAKPILSGRRCGRREIDPYKESNDLPLDTKHKIHNKHIVLEEDTRAATRNIFHSTIASEVMKSTAERTEKSNQSEPTPLPLPISPLPSSLSLSIKTHDKRSWRPDINDNADENMAGNNNNLLVQSNATASTTVTPSSTDKQNNTVWIDHDGQVIEEFDEESGREYNIDVAVRNIEGANENGYILSPALTMENISVEDCDRAVPIQQLNSGSTYSASSSSQQLSPRIQSSIIGKNGLFDTAHAALLSRSQYWWRG